MFSGIIEELGLVKALTKHAAGARLEIACATVLSDISSGASIAVNGVCLTAIEFSADSFSADLAPETLVRTVLGDLRPGDPVNLERPVTLATRLSGHIVQGHVDGVAVIETLEPLGDGNWNLVVQLPAEFDRFLVYKGSITLDGISLTIAATNSAQVRVAIIPHTYNATNLHSRHSGDRIHFECDVLAKHVDKLLSSLEIERSKTAPLQ